MLNKYRGLTQLIQMNMWSKVDIQLITLVRMDCEKVQHLRVQKKYPSLKKG